MLLISFKKDFSSIKLKYKSKPLIPIEREKRKWRKEKKRRKEERKKY